MLGPRPRVCLAGPRPRMLQEIDIEGYAVVDRLRVSFQPGLNLLTGETGSGKSIVVDSLALLFGSRASADVVRAGARRARISGRFDPPAGEAAAGILDDSGIDLDGDELLVERQVLASGKSRAYVNGSPATMGLLRALAPHLGDIHGQHDQQTLLVPAAQLGLLDGYAGTNGDRAELGAVHRRWQSTGSQLERLRHDEQERLRRIDLLRYQAGEIREAGIGLREDEDLGRERARLANAEQLRDSGLGAYDALYESAHSASAQIKAAASALASIASFDERYGRFAASLEDARTTVDDVAFDLRGSLENLESDPRRQQQVEDRLALLETLKRKYGPGLDAVLEHAARCEEELAALEGSDAEAERLERELEEAAAEYSKRSAELSKKRGSAAEDLSARTQAELRELALGKARFEILLEPLPSWGSNGVDRAAYLFSAGPGQDPRPLGQVASGGELSRLALALKTCLEEKGDEQEYRRTLVFDEVDTGVGGRVAEAIGRRLKRLAAGNQVLCVTHLPQIARFADAHFLVSKTEEPDRATAAVRELTESRRVEELARMLSGAEVTEAAMENARQLLESR